MRILADENFPQSIVAVLRDYGHDVLWARTDCAGCRDVDLLDRAEAEARLVLTLDRDFWHIALQRRRPLKQAGVVLFRVHPATPKRLDPLVRAFLKLDKLWAGHVTVVTAEGIQILRAGKS